MDKNLYENVYKFAGMLDGAVEKIDTAATSILNASALVSNYLEGYAQTIRDEADRAAVNEAWQTATDNVSEAEDVITNATKVDITGKSPEEVAGIVKDWMSRNMNNETGGLKNMDQMLEEFFKDINGDGSTDGPVEE